MSVPASPRPLQSLNGMGVLTFALGLMVTFGLIGYATWLAIAAVTAVSATQPEATQPEATQPEATQPEATRLEAGVVRDTGQDITLTPPVAPSPVTPTPSGSTMAFDQLWTAGDGNTIVIGAPTVGISPQEGQVIQVAVTLTNNGEQAWNPESTTFIGTLNGTPTPEATEGDWMYEAPIVGYTSVTLTKVFVGGPGQFDLTVSTPHGVTVFTGRV